MKYICPLLVVSDMKRSRAFYEGVLGRTVKADFGENVSYEGDFAIHLQSHYAGLIDGRPIRYGSNHVELYFEDDNVDAIALELQAKGVEFVHLPREQPWRQKVLRFYDPDGYIIEVGESIEYLAYRLSLEGLTHQQIASAVGIPIEWVGASFDQFAQQSR